ncbi:outer membrane beta-barrel protein [Enterovibrio nigricans]|uniref:Outer membrane insertion C-terminal signal n=1 Tax=Enterovibrio nigricans DSM 22720 TaxID=1121868 RepID=A0A1T4UFL3_9GAMM|nr:outer membrane beta-barrel protein [Enterovibrio nigricans]PKF51075.1 porin family protein [Enterovibrio nigricans]SKA51555.1 outer membrane insertion C-terminal signal [Enterovibrio nigricans DSM 22720]
MKKIGFLAAALALGISSTAQATEGVYVGANMLFGAETEFEISGFTASEDSDVGFDFFIGYQMPISDYIDLGMELEFRFFGEANFSNVLMLEGSAFYFNAKPKFYVDDARSFYVAGLVGFGSMDIEVRDSSGTASDSDSSIQFGIEAGYETESGFGVNLGFKSATAEIQTIDFTTNGFYAGVSYRF